MSAVTSRGPARLEFRVLINHVLAVVPVSDIATARGWYERVLGRQPDNTPMDILIEWQLADHGWLQVSVDPARAGRALVNLAVEDLTGAVDEVASRGIATGEIVQANKGVELCASEDPDGNVVTLIGNFRVRY
jgi:glyoxylase I family protein